LCASDASPRIASTHTTAYCAPRPLLYTFDEADLTRADAFLDRAIELDPNSARAYAYKAWWYVLCIYEERSRNPLRDTALAEAAPGGRWRSIPWMRSCSR